jgi:hypothetical protein
VPPKIFLFWPFASIFKWLSILNSIAVSLQTWHSFQK